MQEGGDKIFETKYFRIQFTRSETMSIKIVLFFKLAIFVVSISC